jgi:capsular polysaccharide biosynthesis protein
MEGNKQMEYEEIDLMDYVKVIIKRKKLIAGIMVIAVVVAGVISFVLPKIYMINASVLVGSVESDGRPIEDIGQIRAKVDNDIYGIEIRKKNNIPDVLYSRVISRNPKDTNLLVLSIESEDQNQSKKIIEEMVGIISSEHEEKIMFAKDLVEKNIKTGGEKIKLIQENVKSTEDKIVPIDSDIERLENKIKHSGDEKANLEAKVESLQKVLPYQQDPGTQFALFDAKERLAGKKYEIESLYMGINDYKKQKDDLQIGINALKAEIESLNSEIDLLNESKNKFKETRVIKPPVVSEKTVSPRPVLNMGIAGVLGLFVGVFAAFGKEWWEKNGKEMKSEK